MSDLDPQQLAVEVVVDVEGAEALLGPQCIGHEVRRLGEIGLAGNLQRLAVTVRPAPLAPAWQVELHGHVDPSTAGLAEAPWLQRLIEQQAKTVAGIVLQVGLDRLDQR